MRYITVKPHGGWAGIGHQFTNWLVSYVLAKKYELKFVHQPFVGETDGTYAQQGSNAFQITRPVKEWNDFLNFGEGELVLTDLPTNIETIQLPHMNANILDKRKNYEEVEWDHPVFKKYLTENHNENILFKISELEQGQFIAIDWNFYKNNNLKQKYNNSEQIKNFKCYFNKDELNIAITIRRGDVTKDQSYGRWMDLGYYLNIMEILTNIKELKNIVFHIYSWNMPEQERKILLSHQKSGKYKIQLHINEDVFSTFYHFTKANIFVSSQGAFSLLANYLTDAIKLTTPFDIFWNNFPSDIEDLIPINDGIFDSSKLLKAMENKNG